MEQFKGTRFKRSDWGELRWILPFVLPAFALIALVILYPFGLAMYYSLTDYNLMRPLSRSFVGLGNYLEILRSGYFWDSLWKTTYFTLLSVGLEFVLGLWAAVFLNKKFRGRGFLRALIILPWALPTVVNGMMWQWIFDANYGALNGLLSQLGFIKHYVIWLGEPFMALNSVIVADVWKNFSFIALLLLAGLQTIPAELYEAATMDGASGWRRFWKVTFPLLKPSILVALVLRTIEAFKVFDIIYMMTKGGPADGTQVLSFYIYRESFQFLHLGFGAALSFMVSVGILILAVVYIKGLYTEVEY
ncbi:MAG: sugar ABC transporter permease [Firmicutes bacterium]|nr:sugar ABC transporter permease [Bacillota bacterium]